MWKLICYEAKKLTSSISGKIILLLFLGICLWQFQQDLHATSLLRRSDIKDVIAQQKKLEGSYETLAKHSTMPDLEYDHRHLNVHRPLDEESTSDMNGFNWKKIYRAYEDGTLSEDEIKEAMNDSSEEKYSLEDFTIYYAYEDDDLWYLIDHLMPESEKMLHRKEYLYTEENKDTQAMCVLQDCDAIQDDVSRNEINRRFLSLPTTYHSNVLGSMLTNNLSYTNFLMLIVLGILFANIFSKETQSKTDIYLASSPNGGVKVIWAKIILCILLGVLIPVLAKIGVLILILMRYGGLDWNMFYFEKEGLISSYLYTFKELIPASLINYSIGTLSLCISILFISQKSKNSYLAAVFALIFVILPIYYEMFRIGGNSVASFFPSNLLMRFSENLSAYSYFNGNQTLFYSIFGIVLPKISIYWIFWIILDTVLIGTMVWEGKRHHITTHA